MVHPGYATRDADDCGCVIFGTRNPDTQIRDTIESYIYVIQIQIRRFNELDIIGYGI